MKKLFLSLVLTAAVLAGYAEEYSVAPLLKDDNGLISAKWSPFQFALLPETNWQLVPDTARIRGLAIAALMLKQQSAWMSVALTSGQCENPGLQIAATTITEKNYGLSIGPIVGFVERNYGVQIGFVNVESEIGYRDAKEEPGAPGLQIGGVNFGGGFQIGVLNYNPKGFFGKFFPIFNFSK